MAWTAPMTAVANAIFTAAQFNANIRDNLLETAPAKATTVGSMFVTSGTNSISERIPKTSLISTGQPTTSATYVDLATVGPAVTFDCGTQAIIMMCAEITGTATVPGFMSYVFSGATIAAASDSWAIRCTLAQPVSVANFILANLNPGTNVITAKFRSGTAATSVSFANRRLTVFPL